MIDQHTNGLTPAICLAELDTSHDEPRVYDLTLARKLGFQHARNIRRLIAGHRTELETHGALIATTDRSGGSGIATDLLPSGPNPRAGRPGKAFYLNEGQALVICALTRTPTAALIRGELVRVFQLHRARTLALCDPCDFEELKRAERAALQAIVRYGDVVMAPPMHRNIRLLDGCDDDLVPYLLVPVTDRILDTLAAFGADTDLEETGDLEPSIQGYYGNESFDCEADDCDDEDGDDAELVDEDGGDIQDEPHDLDCDLEPLLASPDGDGERNQEGWSYGVLYHCQDEPDFGDRIYHLAMTRELETPRDVSRRLETVLARRSRGVVSAFEGPRSVS